MSEKSTEQKIEEITELYYHDVYKFCCARCRNADDAQDVTQATFALLVERKDTLYFDNIRSWLFSVADKKLHELFRQRQRERDYVSIYDVDVPQYNLPDIPDDFDEDAWFDETQKKILQILSEKERALFVKLYIEKKSVSLIAQELDVTEANVRQRKSRLKKKVTDAVKHSAFLLAVLAFKLNH